MHLLHLLNLPETAKPVRDAVEDADLHVAAYATEVEAERLRHRLQRYRVNAVSFPRVCQA